MKKPTGEGVVSTVFASQCLWRGKNALRRGKNEGTR